MKAVRLNGRVVRLARRARRPLALLVLVPAPLLAQVTTPLDVVGEDDGVFSLREAVLAANASPGEDLIELPAGHFVLTIDGNDEDEGHGGDLDVLDDLVLRGQGPGITILDAEGIDRVLETGPNVRLEVSGLTLRGGRAPLGGGVLASGELVVEECWIFDNVADGVLGVAAGGGIYARRGLSVRDCRISGNAARSKGVGSQALGGGLYVIGDLVLERVTVSTNEAVTSPAGGVSSVHGGGVEVREAKSVVVTDTELHGNDAYVVDYTGDLPGEAHASGGGLCMHLADGLEVQHFSGVSFVGNEAIARDEGAPARAVGGALACHVEGLAYAAVDLEGVEVNDNTAWSFGHPTSAAGGAVYFFADAPGGAALLTVRDSELRRNTASIVDTSGLPSSLSTQITAWGGAVACESATLGDGVVQIVNSTLDDNTALVWQDDGTGTSNALAAGGAFGQRALGTSDLLFSRIKDCRLARNLASVRVRGASRGRASGGAIFQAARTERRGLFVSGSELRANQAVADVEGQPMSSWSPGEAHATGGAIGVSTGGSGHLDFTLSRCSLNENLAWASTFGTGVYRNGPFAAGGAIDLGSQSSFGVTVRADLLSSELELNQALAEAVEHDAVAEGGAVALRVRDMESTWSEVELAWNRAEARSTEAGGLAVGGALSSFARPDLALLDCTLRSNVALADAWQPRTYGGAVAMLEADARIFPLLVVPREGSLVVGGSTFLSNSARSEGGSHQNLSSGGALYSAVEILELVDSELRGNRADGVDALGGAVCSSDRLARIERCELVGNEARALRDSIFCSASGGAVCSELASLQVVDSWIDDNLAMSDDRSSGGGIQLGTEWGDLLVGAWDLLYGPSTPPPLPSASSVVRRTTLSDNRAVGDFLVRGGGLSIDAHRGLLLAVNSTFARNHATNGGGIYVGFLWKPSGGDDAELFGLVALGHCTVSGNTAQELGGGLYVEPRFFSDSKERDTYLRSTIIAGNHGWNFTPDDAFGPLLSSGDNLVGVGTVSNGMVDGFLDDQVGTFTQPVDAMLGVLGDNGGFAPTLALLPGSPAIDRDGYLDGDQRSVARPRDGDGDGIARSDVGAYER